MILVIGSNEISPTATEALMIDHDPSQRRVEEGQTCSKYSLHLSSYKLIIIYRDRYWNYYK